MSAERERRVQAITRDIEAYLAVHPHAADSAEGIQRWWLTGTHTEGSFDEVRTALERLTAAGRITRRVLPDGGIVYAGTGLRHEAG
jgi:hypothetical protein